MFWENFYKVCERTNIKPNQLAKKLGISSGVITKWKQGGIPNGETLKKIANFLDCSVDYLLGRTETIELTNSSPKFIKAVLEEFPDKFENFITETELTKNIITPPIGSNYYNVEATRYNKIIEIYEKAKDYNVQELENIIESRQAFELLFEPHNEILETGFWRGFRLNKDNYNNIFIKVYNLYVKSFTARIFISYRINL